MLIRILGSHVIMCDVPLSVARSIKTSLTLPNPAYIGAVRAGKVPIGIEKVLRYYTEPELGVLQLPAACSQMAIREAKTAMISRRDRSLDPIDLEFTGQLRVYQYAAVAEVTRGDHGILKAPTGSGKTIIALAAIVQRQQPALVVVHSQILQDQWVEAACKFLDLPTCEVACIGGNTAAPWWPGAPLTIGIINSVAKCIEQIAPHIGHLVVDECHRAAAPTYWRTLEQFDARYRLGLSATPERRDGLGAAVIWALGPITEVDRGPLVTSGAVLPAEVELRHTDFVTDIDGSEHYQAVIEELVKDPRRNSQIVNDALTAGRSGLVLVLTDRKDHARAIAYGINMIRGRQPPIAYVLVGGQRVTERRRYHEQLESGHVHVICATTQLVGEGFDLPQATTLQLTTPIKWSGKLIQAIGRVLRPAPEKTHGQILDYRDDRVPVLRASGRARAKVYREMAAGR